MSEYATFEGQRKSLIEQLEIDQAIDVGANIGQWGVSTRSLGFSGNIISLEPDPRAFSVLQQRISGGGDKRWRAINIAAGNDDSVLKFNTWDVEGGSSSLLQLTKKGEEFTYHKNEAIPQIDVYVQRLDRLLDKQTFVDKRNLLKIDVQGYELKVLQGCTGILKYISVVEIEIPIVDIYKGGTLLPELLVWFEHKGFELCSIQTERWTGFGAADVDVLFLRRDLFKEFVGRRKM
jgi:FkbM family methyltransferase